jgi:hypothetical protein
LPVSGYVDMPGTGNPMVYSTTDLSSSGFYRVRLRTASTDSRTELAYSYDPDFKELTVAWPTLLGRNYTLQTTTDVTKGWINVPGMISRSGTGTRLSYLDDQASPLRFYRVLFYEVP